MRNSYYLISSCVQNKTNLTCKSVRPAFYNNINWWYFLISIELIRNVVSELCWIELIQICSIFNFLTSIINWGLSYFWLRGWTPCFYSSKCSNKYLDSFHWSVPISSGSIDPILGAKWNCRSKHCLHFCNGFVLLHMDYIDLFIITCFGTYYIIFFLNIRLGEKHQSEPMEHFCAEKNGTDRTEKSHTKIERKIPKMSIQTILYAAINTVHCVLTEFLLIVVLSRRCSLSLVHWSMTHKIVPHTQTYTHSE